MVRLAAFSLASLVLFLSMICFIWKKRPAVSALLLIYYIQSLPETIIETMMIYYVKWLTFFLIIAFWTIVVVRKRLALPFRGLRLTPIWAAMFIFSALTSALLSKTVIEAGLRAATFLLLFSLAYIIMPVADMQRRKTDLFQSIYCFDAVIVVFTVCGIFSSSFFLDGRLIGLLLRATFLVVFAYSFLILSLVKFTRPGSFRLYHGFMILLSLGVIILTKSRGGYLAALGGVLTFFALTRKKIFWALIILVMVTPVLVAPFQVRWSRYSSEVLRGRSVTEVLGDRWLMVRQAFNLYAKNPVFGAGMGSVPASDRAREPETVVGPKDRMAGNTGYMTILYETGAMGLGFYLFWLLSTFSNGIHACRQAAMTGESDSSIYWAGFLALLVAYALHGITEGFPSGAGNIVAVRMWAMSGLFVYYDLKDSVTVSQPHLIYPAPFSSRT